MRSYSHISMRYLRDRLALMAFERRNPAAPWLTKDMIGILNSWLLPSDRGLEWGSGRSTAWLAQRVAQLTTVEDNAEWAGKVTAQLAAQQLGRKVALHHVPVDPADNEDPTRSAYARMADDFEPGSLDFCLVDGDLRDACAIKAVRLVKSGGAIIIDNVERYLPRQNPSHAPNARSANDGCASDLWREFADRTSGWRNIWTTNGVTDTAMWIRPSDGAEHSGVVPGGDVRA